LESEIIKSFCRGFQMLHGACFTFSRKEPREASGRRRQNKKKVKYYNF
jgi:hypothetical protein